MIVAKIGGQDLARKIINSIKYGIEFHYSKYGNSFKGILSLKECDYNLNLNLELYYLYLDWPS